MFWGASERRYYFREGTRFMGHLIAHLCLKCNITSVHTVGSINDKKSKILAPSQCSLRGLVRQKVQNPRSSPMLAPWPCSVHFFNSTPMIILVYGSILPPFPNNWALSSADMADGCLISQKLCFLLPPSPQCSLLGLVRFTFLIAHP
jgi:hypothetical protein